MSGYVLIFRASSQPNSVDKCAIPQREALLYRGARVLNRNQMSYNLHQDPGMNKHVAKAVAC